MGLIYGFFHAKNIPETLHALNIITKRQGRIQRPQVPASPDKIAVISIVAKTPVTIGVL